MYRTLRIKDGLTLKNSELSCIQILTKKKSYYFSFNESATSLLHKYAPIKKKILRYNNNPYMTKMLRKTIA